MKYKVKTMPAEGLPPHRTVTSGLIHFTRPESKSSLVLTREVIERSEQLLQKVFKARYLDCFSQPYFERCSEKYLPDLPQVTS